ncbi:hypothetical protein IEQ34_016398 [Dendrobium chrysotoxum]|uniref:Uncharacterized protein n=1 Tax=Dendrobium chrysotoxum TaxID=161865 RepID=A0AAV7GFM3_DENCH|nr:hypothetical protein IEQ34_016398 [Dendrobium chrysotoxum]
MPGESRGVYFREQQALISISSRDSSAPLDADFLCEKGSFATSRFACSARRRSDVCEEDSVTSSAAPLDRS